MDKSTQRMLRLINQLLEFRKMQNNKLALSLEETDVISFLYEIFLSFGDVAEQKNMNFRFLSLQRSEATASLKMAGSFPAASSRKANLAKMPAFVRFKKS